MNVSVERLPDVPILALQAAAAAPEVGIREGDPLAYRCIPCGNVDEDANEIIHESGCEREGVSKPTAYADRCESFDCGTEELHPDHPVFILRPAETNVAWGVYRGAASGFLCVECGSADEAVAEIIHDVDCRLAGRSKPTTYADRPGTAVE